MGGPLFALDGAPSKISGFIAIHSSPEKRTVGFSLPGEERAHSVPVPRHMALAERIATRADSAPVTHEIARSEASHDLAALAKSLQSEDEQEDGWVTTSSGSSLSLPSINDACAHIVIVKQSSPPKARSFSPAPLLNINADFPEVSITEQLENAARYKRNSAELVSEFDIDSEYIADTDFNAIMTGLFNDRGAKKYLSLSSSASLDTSPAASLPTSPKKPQEYRPL